MTLRLVWKSRMTGYYYIRSTERKGEKTSDLGWHYTISLNSAELERMCFLSIFAFFHRGLFAIYFFCKFKRNIMHTVWPNITCLQSYACYFYKACFILWTIINDLQHDKFYSSALNLSTIVTHKVKLFGIRESTRAFCWEHYSSPAHCHQGRNQI